MLTNESPFAIKEAYVKLRTSLLFCMTADKERPCSTFAITSAKPSEGKSLTAANIAISYAMLGKRVLLVDADMRKPTQRRLWKVRSTAGLCDFLAKISRLELVKVTDLPLWIVCTGTIPPNPSELLSSERMRRFVAESAKTYDCNGVQREHNKKLNNGLPILHKVPPKRDYGRYFCIMAEKGGTSHGGLTEKLSPFFHAKKQEVNAYGR